MATLGEMATGVAHELNQPLSVIKQPAAFYKKSRPERIHQRGDSHTHWQRKSDSHVDRATKDHSPTCGSLAEKRK